MEKNGIKRNKMGQVRLGQVINSFTDGSTDPWPSTK